MKKLILTFVTGLALTACASEPVVKPAPVQLDYSALGRITLATQDFRIVNSAYALPKTYPYIGQLFRPTLVDAVNRWAADRLQAVGSSGHATLVIKDASVTESKIKNMDTGIESWFTREQGYQYTGRVEITINAQGSDGAAAVASASATHNVTVPEAPTEAEKYQAYTKLMDALMKDLDKAAEQAMRDHMGKFIVATDVTDLAPPDAAPVTPVAPLVVTTTPAPASTGKPMALSPSNARSKDW